MSPLGVPTVTYARASTLRPAHRKRRTPNVVVSANRSVSSAGDIRGLAEHRQELPRPALLHHYRHRERIERTSG